MQCAQRLRLSVGNLSERWQARARTARAGAGIVADVILDPSGGSGHFMRGPSAGTDENGQWQSWQLREACRGARASSKVARHRVNDKMVGVLLF